MKIARCSLFHLALPFKGVFEHAQTARHVGNTILVRLTTADGREGWGEILARPYVTGETVESIMSERAPQRVSALFGHTFESQSGLYDWLMQQLPDWRQDLALLGGIELALWSLIEQIQGVDWEALLGAPRSTPTGRCVTIGYDAAASDMRKRAIDAVLKKATVVKVKVGRDVDEDVNRLNTLAATFKGRMPIRIDGNATMSADSVDALLRACKDLPIQSFEEPLKPTDDRVDDLLRNLYARHQVPMMADESVCTVADAECIIASRTYQIFNIRVGKHGGLLASRLIRDLAQAAGMELVGGSMVGESGVLTQASRLLLGHSAALPYVEGLGQNRQFLKIDPVAVESTDETVMDHDASTDLLKMAPFRYRARDCQPYLQSELHLAA